MEHEYMGPGLRQAEGFILGIGAKMFTITGPVIVHGVSTSAVCRKICAWEERSYPYRVYV